MSNTQSRPSHRPQGLLIASSHTRAATALVVMALALMGSSRVNADDLTGRWQAQMELGDAPLTLTLEVSDGVVTAVGLAGPHGPVADMSLEEWSAEDGEVGFRLLGLDRPYRFSGTLGDDGALVGNLKREPPPVPSTDLYLMTVTSTRGTAETSGWQLGAPVNLTDREGYDNQPYFLPDGRSVLYTSMRDGQSDIYRYELGTQRTFRVTTTDESEYSPTPLPDGTGFSTIRVEADGIQRLWAFDLDGSSPRLLLERVAPVGYHAWLDETTLALFVLGQPSTLQIADVRSGEASIREESIGRALHRTPGQRAVSFVHKVAEGDWRIESLPAQGGTSETLLATLPESEDFVWTPAGSLLMGSGSELHLGEPGSDRWERVADLSSHRVRGITRLALSPDGRHLVVVGVRPDPSPHPESIRLRLVRQP